MSPTRAIALLLLPVYLLAETAVPGATAADWLADPEAAAKAAGATAKHLEGMGAGAWAAISAAALVALAVMKTATPIISRLVPVWGPMVEGLANAAWAMAATKDQKAADAAAQTAKEAAAYLVVIANAARSLPAGTLPDHIQQMVHSPIVSASIEQLSGGKT